MKDPYEFIKWYPYRDRNTFFAFDQQNERERGDNKLGGRSELELIQLCRLITLCILAALAAALLILLILNR